MQVWEGVVSGEALEDPSLLSRFFAVTYAVSVDSCSHGNKSDVCVHAIDVMIVTCVLWSQDQL